MKSYHWFKAWNTAILDDPEVDNLPDWAWRVYWKCYAAAKVIGKDGLLPTLDRINWYVRPKREDTVADALRLFGERGLARETPDGWLLLRFADEQAPVPDAKRKQLSRYRHNTVPYRDIEDRGQKNQRTEDKDDDVVARARPNIFSEYENTFGLIKAGLQDELIEAEETYPADWITEAFKIARDNGARGWGYTRAILEDWSQNGKNSRRKNGSKQSDNDLQSIIQEVVDA